MALKLLIAALCVLANGFFVAAEFGLVKVRVSQLLARSRKGDQRAIDTLEVVQKIDSYLPVTQLGITASSLALGWLGQPAVARLLQTGLVAAGLSAAAPDHAHPAVQGLAFTIAFLVITAFHIVLGEQAPKMLAIRKAESVSLAVSGPIRLLYLVTLPYLWVLGALSRLSLRALRVPADGLNDSVVSAEEIRVILSGGQLEANKRELIERVMLGTDRPVRAVMVPRVDMATVSLSDPPERVMAVARTTGYSRLPLTEERDPDKVIGYLYVKDLMVGEGLPAGGIRALRRDILFVPESRKVGDALKDFQKTRIPIAIVVDEYGGTSGLITVEDILEEIVGELQDELDMEPPRVVRREGGDIIIDGMLPIGDLAQIGIEVEPIEGHDTVAGYMVAELGRLARPGDVVRVGPYDATVEDVRRRRVTRVRLTLRAESIHPPAVEELPAELPVKER